MAGWTKAGLSTSGFTLQRIARRLCADSHRRQHTPQARQAVATSAWYRKRRPTFADTLAAVRREFWREQGFATSYPAPNMQKLRPALRAGIAYALCNAA